MVVKKKSKKKKKLTPLQELRMAVKIAEKTGWFKIPRIKKLMAKLKKEETK